MKRKINLSLCLLSAAAVLVTAFVVVALLYNDHCRNTKASLRSEIEYIAAAANADPSYTAKVLHTTSDRVTVISSGGDVLLDSGADAASLGSHSDRPEFLQALSNGYGESTRISSTISEQTFYCAMRLEDGSVLRLARTTGTMLASYLSALPVLLLCIILVLAASVILSGILTRRIVAPINTIDLENADSTPYDELAPLLERIRVQNRKIGEQVNTLNEKERELSSLSENMKEGFIMLNSHCEVLTANRSARRILSIKNEDIRGKNLLELNRSLELDRLVTAACGGKKGNMTLDMDGRTYRLLAGPVSGSGAVLLILDVTEELEREQLRKEFSANVSHELKTPLTVISGYAELLKSGQASDSDSLIFADKIYTEAGRLIALVEDIIKLSYLDENRTLPRTEPIDLYQTAQDVADSLAPKCRLRNIEFNISGSPAIIQGINPLLREMVYNLCENAVKYNTQNGRVDVNVWDNGGDIRLEVKDTGIGIPERDLERVFERFYRVDKSRSKAYGGTGLGLSIVKHGAAVHKARIKLSSSLNKGTTATLIFSKPANNTQ